MKHIQNIIDDHINRFGLRPEIPLKALTIQFNHHLYTECVLEVLRHYNLSLKLRIVPAKLEKASARILLPQLMPAYSSSLFKSLRFRVEYDQEHAKISMERFVFAIAHEIGHILLSSKGSPYHDSEIATDLVAMVMGFDALHEKGRVIKRVVCSSGSLWAQTSIVGYLSEEESSFARKYIISRRKLS